MTITKSDMSILLSGALYDHFPCIVPPGGDRWTASVRVDTDNPRVFIERVSNNSIYQASADGVMSVDVSLDSDRIEPEDGFTANEVEVATWCMHVEKCVDSWAESMVEQHAGLAGGMRP